MTGSRVIRDLSDAEEGGWGRYIRGARDLLYVQKFRARSKKRGRPTRITSTVARRALALARMVHLGQRLLRGIVGLRSYRGSLACRLDLLDWRYGCRGVGG